MKYTAMSLTPAPHIAASLIFLANNKKKKTPKKSKCGGVSCDINDMKRKPREMSQLGKKYY
jgi:UDP-3-O-[3-hydroxymyristoyl] glucosamine N-acyltransferase